MAPEYDDGYPSCARTFATLWISAPDLDPGAVFIALGLEPTQSCARGDVFGPDGLRRRTGAWSLSTEGELDSLDVRRHIDWLLDRIEPHSDAIAALIDDGADVDVFCYWESRYGSGGPMLSPAQSGRLASLGIDVGFDCYPPEAVWDALQAAPQVPPPGFPGYLRYF